LERIEMVSVRKAEERDRDRILSITRAVGVFTGEDVGCVDELLETYLHKANQQEYYFLVACDGPDQVLGYTAYGPTPLTQGTYDMYWLAVAPEAQGRGLAKLLFLTAEEELVAAGARLIVLETSGTPEYAPARGMYKRLGYAGGVAVPDFYRPGDDLMIYYKHLRKHEPSK
jgi:ribosomal protein S18 acetylase RimI-like enzyme